MAPFTYCLVAFLLLFQQAWFAAGDGDVCDTVTETRTMLAGTTVSDRDSFTNSLNSVYSTPHITGKVIFYSSLMTYPGGSFTAYAVYNPDALTSAGYSFSSETVVVTHCPDPEPTASALMPSPVSSGSEPQGDHAHGDDNAGPTITATCSPHVDHWHCPPGLEAPTTPPSPEDLSKATAAEATATTTEAAAATCSPHVDHWHCPPGVEAPTTPPSPEDLAGETSASATCSPHHDHWHCPPGVESPTTPPGPADFASATATPTDASSEPTATPTGAAAHVVAGHLFKFALLSLVVAFLL